MILASIKPLMDVFKDKTGELKLSPAEIKSALDDLRTLENIYTRVENGKVVLINLEEGFVNFTQDKVVCKIEDNLTTTSEFMHLVIRRPE